MKEIVIKLSDTEYNQLIYGDDGLDYEVLEQAVVNGAPIPDNATNGDVIKAMFPNIEVEEQGKDLFIVFNMDIQGTPFYKAWWNAPYQKGGKE